MDKRIRLVWVLSFATMLLILCGQAYWLYNQYVYTTQDAVRNMQVAVDSVMEQEYEIRYDKFLDLREPNSQMRSEVKIEHSDSIRLWLGKGGSGESYGNYTFSVSPWMPKPRKVTLANASAEYTTRYIYRYLTTQHYPLSRHLIDSLLADKGYGPMLHPQIHRSNVCVQPARFSVSGGLRKVLHVEFSVNPFAYKNLHFDLTVPVSSIIRAMAWQMAGSLLLMLVLAFCLVYQMRTILIQKRIDTIRREFMKNMIYEMKQPEEPATDTEVIRIGYTDFYYTLNELRFGQDRVIITSRQAELLRLLAESQGEVVSREHILQQIWGDDSYSNSLALNVQITYLRRALRSDTSLSIEAVIKRGYVLKVRTD